MAVPEGGGAPPRTRAASDAGKQAPHAPPPHPTHPAPSAQIQSIPLPAPGIPSGGSGGCASIGSTVTEGYPQLSADQRYLVVPCYSTATGGSATASGARTVVRLDSGGNVDSTTTFSGASSENFRSVTTVDGSAYWLSTSNGLKYVAHGAAGTAAVQVSASSASSMRGSTIGNGAWWGALASSPYGVMRIPQPLPTTAGSVAVANFVIPAIGNAATSLTSVVSESPTAVWVSSFNSGPLHKGVRPDTTTNFTVAPGYPKTSLSCANGATPVSVTALRGMVGRVVDGVYTLFATTGSATGSNFLVRFNTVTEVCTVVAAAAANTDFRGAALPPTPTPTPSSSPTGTATPSSGAEPSTSNTPSGTGTASPSASPAVCAAAGTSPAGAPRAGNIIALRIGTGALGLGSVGLRERCVAKGTRRGRRGLPPRRPHNHSRHAPRGHRLTPLPARAPSPPSPPPAASWRRSTPPRAPGCRRGRCPPPAASLALASPPRVTSRAPTMGSTCWCPAGAPA